MTTERRDRLALALAGIALLAGLASLLAGRVDTGIRLERQGDRIIVADVGSYSLGARDGVERGMVVLAINDIRLIQLPEKVPAGPAPTDADGNPTAEPPMVVRPLVPTPVTTDPAILDSLASRQIATLETIQPWDLAQGSPEVGWATNGFQYYAYGYSSESLPAAAGGILLFAALWWVRSGRAGEALRPLAVPLAVATATPFLLRPLNGSWWPPAVALGGILAALAMLPLADALLERIDIADDRRLVRVGVVAFAIGAAIASVALVVSQPFSSPTTARWALISAIPLLPGLAAAGPLTFGAAHAASATSGRLLQSAEFAIAGATPMFALGTDQTPYVFPLALWLLIVFVAGRFTIRPLARLATRAQLQRDLVVAATEAERARVAADIHDDALQELTLLVRRLDAAGDAEGADIARTVSDRLRAICGDLRLPILDDLGVGPALDWLVVRIERLAGGEVRLERADGTRPPPDVELAIFRVAQEALANAVKHGKPPIVVRYRASDEGASLSIDDAGPGIGDDAGAVAEREGRFGLLNMEQRAQAIGAILDVRRWPTGGTHVALEWRPR
ncbi:MAG TPA: ATP-binding protein [Candidatus Limnocylindrales bacterium]